MTDSSAGLIAVAVPTPTGQTGPSAVGRNASVATNQGEFPALFQQVSHESLSGGELQPPATIRPAFIAAWDTPLLPAPVPAGSPGVIANGMNPALPATDSQDGNSLPIPLQTIALSGFTAVTDQQGSRAVSFIGDDNQVVHTPVSYATQLPAAVRQSQQDLADYLALQPLDNHKFSERLPTQANLLAGVSPQLSVPTDLPELSANSLQSTSPTAALHAAMTTGDSSLHTLATRAADPIQVMPQHPQWAQQVGERISWMIGQGLQQADVRLNPPELGSLEIRIQVQGDQANVQFTSPHHSVRDALDAALPRLREMLEQSGLSLGDASVSSQSRGQHGDSRAAAQPSSSAHAEHPDTEQELPSQGHQLVTTNGLVDIYA